MPIYEYRCSKCGDFEVMQRITDKALTKCPTCKAKVSKLMSNTSFQLKGTGWYVTDYAKAGKTGAAESSGAGDGSAAETKPEAKSETKAEAKPEAKSDTKAGTKSESKSAADGKGKAAA